MTVWRGVRFGKTAHPFAPSTVAEPADVAPGGEFGPAPMQIEQPAFPLGAPTSTDSLFLNIWAPDGAADLPVLIWVYGGGFEAGAASAPWFDGDLLARETPCVVVTVNYRVGAFGFAALDHLDTADAVLSGAHNLGLGDVVTAMQWVAQNIEGFGGDPAAITLAGHSAGGFLTAAAAVAPGAPTLRAIACFSGGASRIVSRSAADELGTRLVDELGLRSAPAEIIAAPPETVLAAQGVVGPRALDVRNGRSPRGFGVVDDADAAAPLVPRHPMDAIAQGALRDTFLLSSAALDEAEGFPVGMIDAPDVSSFRERAEEFCGSAAVAEALLERADGDVDTAWRTLLSDFIYRLPAVRAADAQGAAGGRAMHLDISRADGEPAVHGTEVGALFGRGAGARDEEISRVFRRLIATGTIQPAGFHVVGDPLPAQRVAGPALLGLWAGVSRP